MFLRECYYLDHGNSRLSIISTPASDNLALLPSDLIEAKMIQSDDGEASVDNDHG